MKRVSLGAIFPCNRLCINSPTEPLELPGGDVTMSYPGSPSVSTTITPGWVVVVDFVVGLVVGLVVGGTVDGEVEAVEDDAVVITSFSVWSSVSSAVVLVASAGRLGTLGSTMAVLIVSLSGDKFPATLTPVSPPSVVRASLDSVILSISLEVTFCLISSAGVSV